MTSPLASKNISEIGMAGVAHAKKFLASDDQKKFIDDMTDGLDAKQREVYLMNLTSAVVHRRKTLVDKARGFMSGQFNKAQKRVMEEELRSLTEEKIETAKNTLRAAGSKNVR